MRAAGHIAAEAHLLPLHQVALDRGNAAGHIHVGLGAVGDEYAVFLHERPLGLAAPHAVGHYGGAGAPEQAEPAVGLAVKIGAGAELFDPGDLGQVLGQVGLQGLSLIHILAAVHGSGRAGTRAQPAVDAPLGIPHAGHRLQPVSYTHLDVYKRQIHN